MLKRIWSYQNILCKSAVSGNQGIVLFIVIPIVFSIFTSYEMRLPEWLCLALCWIGMGIIENHSSRLQKTLPVSDKFAVANMLFVFPLYIGSLSLAGILVILVVLQVVLEVIIEGRMIDFSGMVVSMADILGFVFALLVSMGIWFWMCLGAFHKDRKVRKKWHIAVGAVCVAGIWILDTILEAMGIRVDFALGDLPVVFPTGLTMFAGLAFALISGVLAWLGSLRLYRRDIKGQTNTPDTGDKIEAQLVNTVSNSVTGTKRAIGTLIVAWILILGVFVVMLVGGSILGPGESQNVDIVTSNPAEYSVWDSYEKEMGIEEDILETGEVIFPENMDVEYMDEYFAKIDGKFKAYDDGYSASISSLRFMVATLPEEEYQKEKERLAGITVTCEDEAVVDNVNHILHDTEHFPAEAYIAVYEDNYEYEYALADDENQQITYVYACVAPLKEIPTEVDFRAKTGTDVISMQRANTDMKGFSIYSFWDEETGVFFSETP